MTGAGPVLPSLAQMRTLVEAAKKIDTPAGVVLELCLVTLCLPWEATAIELQRIDWRRAVVDVPARGGRRRVLALPNAALQTILRVAGSAGGTGQAVTAGRGRPLAHRDVRLDRLRERLADAVPATVHVDWNFHGIRASASGLLKDAGTNAFEIEAVLGREVAQGPPVHMRDDARIAIVVAEKWCRMLLSGSPRPPRTR